MLFYWFKSPLLIATEANNLTEVRSILASATSEMVNRTYGAEKTTALLTACQLESNDIALAILSHPGIDINQKGNTWCPLSCAARNGGIDIVRAILAHPELDLSESEALCWAARGGHVEIVRTLLSHPGISVNFVGSDHSSALGCAAHGNHVKVVEALLAVPGIDVNQVDDASTLYTSEWGYSPLNHAAVGAFCDVVRLLLTHPDIDSNIEDQYLGTPLRGLLRTDYDYPRCATPTADVLTTARLLLRHPGVKVDLMQRVVREEEIDGNETDVQFSVPENDAAAAAREALHNQFVAAVICEDMLAVESLLTRHELDVNVMCVMNRTFLHWAAFFGLTEMVRLLLVQPGIIISLASLDAYERTPLALAAKHGHTETVKVLLAHIGELSSEVCKSTLYAALVQHEPDFDESDTPVDDLVATLRVLVAHPDIDLSALVKEGPPAKSNPDHAQFIAAAVCGYTEKVQVFLARPDIDVNVAGMCDNTPLIWATYLNHKEIVLALLQHPRIVLSPESHAGQLQVAFCCAVHCNRVEIANIIQSRFDHPHTLVDEFGLLSNAVIKGRVDMVKLLLGRPTMDVTPVRMRIIGRPSPERTLCEELVLQAHRERQTGSKTRSWWEAFGLV